MGIKVRDFDDILKKDYNKNACKEVFVDDIKDKLFDYYEKGYPMGESSMIKGLDDNFRWRKGFLYCFSGYPQSGKSEIINYLSILRAYHYKDKIMMYSPETNTAELVLNLCQAYLGKNVNPLYGDTCKQDEMNKALEFISNHFAFLENNDEMPTINSLVDKFEDYVEKGFNNFIIDPLNWVVESNAGESNMYQYLKLTLTILKQFAKNNDSIMTYIEHPKTPSLSRANIKPRANSYSLAGGTMHFNKTDCMVIMHRLDDNEVAEKIKGKDLVDTLLLNQEKHIKFVEFETVKMKSQRLNGTLGSCFIQYDLKTGRYK
tara:strand:- start:3478 stop:4428 length:951 start_codon:yes stop_codon:yes gene_type:complete